MHKTINSRKPKQVSNFYLILPPLNLNASNSQKKKKKKKNSLPPSLPSAVAVAVVLFFISYPIYSCWLAIVGCCYSLDPRSTSVVVHTHTWVELAKIWWIWKISFLSQVHICVFFFSALLLCLCPLRF